MPTDPQTLAIWLAGLIVVPILAALFKAWQVGIPVKLWVEMLFAIILAYIALVITGGLPLVPSMPFGDPIKFFAAFAEIFSKVFALAVIVYVFLGDKLNGLASSVKIKLAGL
jgi:hypothetical protein